MEIYFELLLLLFITIICSILLSVSCPPGFVSSSGEAPCSECGVNTYSSNGLSCTTCPSNTLAAKTGSASITECLGND